MMTRSRIPTALVVLFGVLSPGCDRGPAFEEIRGTVTLNGQPVERGVVRFVPADTNRSSEAGTITNGNYTARVPPGTLRVEFMGSRVDPGAPIVEGAPAARSVFPPRYNQESKITIEVGKGGKNQFDFDLTVTPAEDAALRSKGPDPAVKD